ncbi:hypothetical protein DFH08DRAFT_790130 [Mycena albidolilacea]|uniref:Uncharacterized protein n=1 Tax=Mycena albidolilacea TaxID=1033008 RepID=A0AAD6ZE19_9AGAR|nr:hypothetical protein DFH08DRAFT_790130 [Mycena albidolilacea]
MFTGNKSVLACASIFLALAAQTSAHAMPSIALGVKGTPQRSDVQRPSTASPCGSIAIAANLDTSTAIPVAADGTVTMNVQNFNAGGDGSTSVSVQIDQTGAGTKFVAGTVKTNGNPNPTKIETDKVIFSLPAGTKCTGGKAKNLCLVSVKTTAGFGACTVVSQNQAAAAAPPAVTTATKATTSSVKTTTKASSTPAKATTTQAVTSAKAQTSAKSNKNTSDKAAAAKTQSKANGKKKHHHHKGKGKGKGKGKKAAANKQATGQKNRAIESEVEVREYEEVEAEYEEVEAREYEEVEAREYDSSALKFARELQ